jgi:ubiquitin-conjugating enzyme E2 H
MSSSVIKRIMRDIRGLKNLPNIDLFWNDEQPYIIQCKLKGPGDTPYSNGVWRISLIFPEQYPFKSPSIGFKDSIYHPNIDYKSGSVCLNVLNENWSPIYTAEHIITTFLPQLLTYPNPDDPLNLEAAELYVADLERYNIKVENLINTQNNLRGKK